MVPVTILTCIITYYFVVRFEEVKLTELYGEAYTAYLSKLPRWLPRRLSAPGLYWSRKYLCVSVRVEAYNLLFIIPVVVKEMLH